MLVEWTVDLEAVEVVLDLAAEEEDWEELAVTFLSMLDAAELLAELVVEEVALEEVELVVVCAELVAFATVLLARDCDVLNVAAWAACLVVDAACVAAADLEAAAAAALRLWAAAILLNCWGLYSFKLA